VHLSLDTSRCSDFCIDTVQATLFRPSSPYAPAKSPVLTTCESAEAIVFEFIAGTTLFAEVQMSSNGETVMDGQSDEGTVATDQDTQLDVVLAPTAGSGPTIVSVDPNPVVEGDSYTVYGDDLPDQDGWWAVEVDGTPLDVEGIEWSETGISVDLQDGIGGTGLRIRNCGLVSNELPLRIIKQQLNSDGYPFSACSTLIDLEIYEEDGAESALVLCSDSESGNLTRFDFDSCAVSQTVASFALSQSTGAAQHLSLLNGGGLAWIVFEGGGIQQLDLDDEAQVLASGTLPTEATVEELVCNEDGCSLLSRDSTESWTVWSVQEDSGKVTVTPAETSLGMGAEESPRVLYLSNDALYVATHDESLGHAKLRKVGASSNTEVSLEDCVFPISLTFAENNNWVAVTCQDSDTGKIFLVDLSSSEVSYGVWNMSAEFNAPRALSFDVDSDVLLLVAEDDTGQQEIVLLKIETDQEGPSISPVQTWSFGENTAFSSLHRTQNANRFVGLGYDNELILFHPYLGTDECADQSRAEGP
jgi:hypothetical protein